MKLSFDKQELLKGLNIAMKAVSSNTIQPILKYLLIDASSSEIKLISNDMELAIETTINGTIIEKGAAAIEGKIFYDIIRKLPDSEIIVDVNERLIVNIKCGKSEFNISGQEAIEFPYPPSLENESSLSLSQFVFKDMIRQTIFSLNLNENNKMMTGELLEIKNNNLRLVSLDGHRIAIRKIALEGNYDDVRVIIPGKALSEISKIISDNIDEYIEILFSENHVSFSFENTIVYSRLIDGDYFDVDRMISGDYKTKLTVDKKEFFECVERAGLLIKEGEGKPIILGITDGNMELDVKSSMGTMSESVAVEKEGDDIRIGFNPRFLTDALKVIDDESVDLYMLNKRAPCYIKDKDENYLFLILPVNTSDGR